MESLNHLTFFNKYNDHIQKLKVRLALIYNDNEGVIVDWDDDVHHYLNTGVNRIELLCGQQIIHFGHQWFKYEDKLNYYILALTPKQVYGIGKNVANVSLIY